MSVNEKTVRHIARLARLAVNDEDIAPLAQELSKILGFVEQLNELDTGNVAPLARVVAMPLRMREDAVTDGNIPEKIIANAPAAEDGFFAVPKVLE
jgi:aspartyl-tRNA(Asn)/glutamyl-tRNA(Gln) amidotransferase subunit C